MYLPGRLRKTMDSESKAIIFYLLNTALLLLIFKLTAPESAIVYPALISLTLLATYLTVKAVMMHSFLRWHRLCRLNKEIRKIYSIIEGGFSLTESVRKDVTAAFSRLISELLEYSKDGSDIMIENGWLERVPEAANRQELIQ